jgi:hypothetical protein
VPPECLSETFRSVGQYSAGPSVFIVQGISVEDIPYRDSALRSFGWQAALGRLGKFYRMQAEAAFFR